MPGSATHSGVDSTLSYRNNVQAQTKALEEKAGLAGLPGSHCSSLSRSSGVGCVHRSTSQSLWRDDHDGLRRICSSVDEYNYDGARNNDNDDVCATDGGAHIRGSVAK